MKKLLTIIIIALTLTGCSASNKSIDNKHNDMFIESDGNMNGYSISKVVDKETGCKYLLVNTGSGVSVTPMVSEDGRPLCTAGND